MHKTSNYGCHFYLLNTDYRIRGTARKCGKKMDYFSTKSGFLFNSASLKSWMLGTEEKLWNIQISCT